MSRDAGRAADEPAGTGAPGRHARSRGAPAGRAQALIRARALNRLVDRGEVRVTDVWNAATDTTRRGHYLAPATDAGSAAGMAEARGQFRRVNGHLHLARLGAELERATAENVAADRQNEVVNAA